MFLVNKNFVGRCGLYCGTCLVYRAYKDSEQLRAKIAKEEDCRPEEIRCQGCQTVLINGWNSKEWGRNCGIVKCQESKGLKFCYECDAYPDCEKFHRIADGLHKRGVDLLENLTRIKAGQTDEWLKDQEEKWRCRKCHKPVSAYLDECHWCGARIKPD